MKWLKMVTSRWRTLKKTFSLQHVTKTRVYNDDSQDNPEYRLSNKRPLSRSVWQLTDNNITLWEDMKARL